MKKIMIALLCLGSFSLTAQIKTPQPSPAAKAWQTVGLTEVTVEYSRPAKRDRVIFGELVPYDKMWRTGANKNTMITVDNSLIFGKDTLEAGTYAIFTTPKNGKSWDVYFYTDTENWGTPEDWKEENVALQTTAVVSKMSSVTESFTVGIDNVQMDGAELTFSWDKVKAVAAFSVTTTEAVMADIKKTMAGPSAGDYYKAADFYLSQKMEMNTALEYINTALEMRGDDPFWYLRRKALIQAELGQYKEAISTAKLSLAAAKEANYDNYVKMNTESIQEWSKKVK
ncbi:MAG: DUF2911 domain-containing protein [Crocinitomicaceae bacterium]|nr:DUF2911 domain-containing protein [Crocinitomicaceae bacterium]